MFIMTSILFKERDDSCLELLFHMKINIIDSGGARVFAARGKRLCCCPHSQISNCYSYGYNDSISVDCEQYAKLGCKISEFHIFAPPNAAPCTVPPRANAPFASPYRHQPTTDHRVLTGRTFHRENLEKCITWLMSGFYVPSP